MARWDENRADATDIHPAASTPPTGPVSASSSSAATPAQSPPSTAIRKAAVGNPCKHSDKDAQGKPWLTASKIGARIDALNISSPASIHSRLSSLDATLFKDNKTGWDACQANVARWATDFIWSYMSMGAAKKRGFWAECRSVMQFST